MSAHGTGRAARVGNSCTATCLHTHRFGQDCFLFDSHGGAPGEALYPNGSTCAGHLPHPRAVVANPQVCQGLYQVHRPAVLPACRRHGVPSTGPAPSPPYPYHFLTHFCCFFLCVLLVLFFFCFSLLSSKCLPTTQTLSLPRQAASCTCSWRSLTSSWAASKCWSLMKPTACSKWDLQSS